MNFWSHAESLFILTKKSHCSSKLEILLHKNLVFRPLSRLFNISQLSEMHFKTIILHSCWIWALYNRSTVPEVLKCKQHKTRTTDTLWTYKYTSNQNQLIMGKSNRQIDLRNWVYGKDQNRWNMNICNLGYTKQSKEVNKKATWLPIKHTVYCMVTEKFYQYTKN